MGARRLAIPGGGKSQRVTCRTGRQARISQRETYLLLVLLVYGVHGVLDSHAFHGSCHNFEAQGEVQGDLLDWWVGEVKLEDVFLLNCVWRRVDLPVSRPSSAQLLHG